MSRTPGAKGVVIGLGGAAMTVGSVLAYASGMLGLAAMGPAAVGLIVVGAVVVPCLRQPVALTVTPDIGQPASTIWWRNGAANPAVSIMLTLSQQPGPGRYQGGGTLNRGDGKVEVFRDQTCLDPVVFDRSGNARITLAELTSVQPFYLRGANPGNVGLRLTLDPATDAQMTVQGPARQRIAVVAVNVITPVITAEPLVLVAVNDPADPTTMSTVTLSCTQSNPAYPCNDLEIALTYGNAITCWLAAAPATAYASGTASAVIPLALLMQGVTAGNCALSAALASASGAVDPSWFIAPAINATTRVEQLAFAPFQYAAGGANAALGMAAGVRVAGPSPKLRALHQRIAGGHFPVARVPIRRPDPAFWTGATHLTLTAGAGVQLFSDAAATVAAVALQQADFVGAEYDLWVATTAVTPMDPQSAAPFVHPLPLRNPERVLARRRIYCGATVGGRQLLHGDIVDLDTFSYDQQLDRRTGNLTSAQLAVPRGTRDLQSALSVAGAHKYDDHFSAHMVNHQNPAPYGGLHSGFCNALINTVGTNAVKAAAGEAYVTAYLLNTHNIALHPTTGILLTAHILRVLTAAGMGGFPQGVGTPGTHAEILAVNQLLAAGIPIAEISAATYKVHHSNGRGKHFAACTNCRGILAPPGLPSARLITG